MNLLEIQNTPTHPFLKWAGGKRWLVRNENQIAPSQFDRYLEPFVGGGSVFFSLKDTPFVISDANPELINCYIAIKDDWGKVLQCLKRHQRLHSDRYYYEIRASKPRFPHTKAAKFIYLNRTCWNGLYRVNLSGEFNVPRGTKDTVLLGTDDFPKISCKLSDGKILCQDFELTLSMAGKGDFVFVDPPYTVKHNLNGFIKYNEKIFSWEDQERLKGAIQAAAARGAMVTMTNADHESIHKLYSGMCDIEEIRRSSVIAGKSKNRGVTSEVLMRIGWSV